MSRERTEHEREGLGDDWECGSAWELMEPYWKRKGILVIICGSVRVHCKLDNQINRIEQGRIK